MAITINAKGTSTQSFAIGKGGPVYNSDGSVDLPTDTDLAVNLSGTGQLMVSSSTSTGVITTNNTNLNISATAGGGTNLLLNGLRWPASDGTTGQVLKTDGSGVLSWITASGTGTVTSVSGTGTVSGLTLSGTVTTSGNLTLGGTLAVTPDNFASQTANTFLAAPNGTSGVPTFRSIVAADIPTLNQNTTGSAALNVLKAGDTMSGNLNFSGSGLKITGDYSNATFSSRLMFQSNVTNGNTSVGAIPNGTAGVSNFRAYASSDANNAPVLDLGIVTGSDARITSAPLGTGQQLPLHFYIGTNKVVEFGVNRRVTLTPNNEQYALQLNYGSTLNGPFIGSSGTDTFVVSTSGGASQFIIDSNSNQGLGVTPSAWNNDYRAIDIGANGSLAGRVGVSNTVDLVSNAYRASDGNWKYKATGPAARIMLDGSSGSFFFYRASSGTAGNNVTFSNPLSLISNGDVLVTGSGGFGYGAGSGGTVTQATSKSTTVTLNKPSGQITMNNAALAAGATVIFLVVNSVVSITDTISLATVSGTAADPITDYQLRAGAIQNGGFYIAVTNMSGSSKSDALGIQFNVIKGATS